MIGPGFYDSANPDNTVTVVGAGRDRDDRHVADLDGERLQPRPAQLRDAVGSHSQAVRSGGARTRTRCSSSARPIRVGLSSSTTSDARGLLRRDGAPHQRERARRTIDVRGTLEDSDMIGGRLYTGTGASIIRRMRVVSPYGVDRPEQLGRDLELADRRSTSTCADGAWRISASPVPNSQATTVLSNDTFIGGGWARLHRHQHQRGQRGLHARRTTTRSTDATIANTIVRNCKTTLVPQLPAAATGRRTSRS